MIQRASGFVCSRPYTFSLFRTLMNRLSNYNIHLGECQKSPKQILRKYVVKITFPNLHKQKRYPNSDSHLRGTVTQKCTMYRVTMTWITWNNSVFRIKRIHFWYFADPLWLQYDQTKVQSVFGDVKHKWAYVDYASAMTKTDSIDGCDLHTHISADIIQQNLISALNFCSVTDSLAIHIMPVASRCTPFVLAFI